MRADPSRLGLRSYRSGDASLIVAAGARIEGPAPVIDATMLATRLVWTLTLDGRPVAAAALIHNYHGYATLSAIVGRIPLRLWPEVRRWTHETLAALMERHGEYRRIDCAVDPEQPSHVAFARGLGFAAEGRMAAYGPGAEDFLLMARVRRDAESAT